MASPIEVLPLPFGPSKTAIGSERSNVCESLKARNPQTLRLVNRISFFREDL